MIDTLNMFIERGNVAGDDSFAILPYLDNVTERQSDRIGYSCSGTCGDYNITAYQAGISLKGSLAKYYLPSNVSTLQRSDVKLAIEMMSDKLHIDIKEAKVGRLDVSTVIPTKRQPCEYYSSLGNKQYFERVQATKDTLYYNTQKRRLIFYDKTKEARAKRAIIPQSLIGCNLLRYELRFEKELPRQFKTNILKTKMLYDEAFYYSLVQRWRNEFLSIQKINTVTNMEEDIKTVRDAKNTLFAMFLKQDGAMTMANDYIAELKAKNVFADPKYYTRLKADLYRIMKTRSADKENELMQELEKAITDIAKYAR